jgi:DNA-binding response OmpR family regulator
MRILIVEDDAALADAIGEVLRRAGYVVDHVVSGEHADTSLRTGHYDLVLLDIELPGMDGFAVLERLRRRKSGCPVLMITARDALHDRIHGLETGADDYLVKPFKMGELVARVRALIRRATTPVAETIDIENMSIDLAGHRVRIDGIPVELTARELAVLEALARRAGSVVTKDRIIASAFPAEDQASPNNLEVHVSRLRRKLAAARIELRPVRGLGYLLDVRRER